MRQSNEESKLDTISQQTDNKPDTISQQTDSKLDNISQQTDKKPPKSKKLRAAVIIAAAAAAAVVGTVIYLQDSDKKPKEADGVVGVISNDWDPGIDQEAPTERVGIQIPGYSTAKMREGDNSLHLSIGNPKDNSCGFYATLKLRDGTVLYKSELLQPGFGLTEVPLNQELAKGEYDAVVYFECVALDEAQTPLNSAESEFKLIVN